MNKHSGRLAAVLASVAALVAVSVPGTAAAAPWSAIPSCSSTDRGLTAEEARLSRPEPARFIIEGGLGDAVAAFGRQLCAARSPEAAERIVSHNAATLWRAAVARAQGRGPVRGTLSAGDDRPLYWARLAMAATVRGWEPRFALSPSQRAALIKTLERVSRGHDDIGFPGGRGVRRVLVTGFDPFTLDRDIRQANPSGAAALALDGRMIDTPDGPVRIETALFPVRWRDFGDGMVERALAPVMTGRAPADIFATVSQGRPGRFDLEAFNGAWRGGFADNENVCYRGRVPIASGLPTITPQPEWTNSTLPRAAMVAATTGSYPVIDNRQVTEVPGDTPDEPATTTCPAAASPGTPRTDGPTAGSQARSGGGGDYLSNEIAYRATLLRDAVGLRVPGGHIHTPVLTGLSATDPAELSNPEFEANREAISAQVRALVLAAVGT